MSTTNINMLVSAADLVAAVSEADQLLRHELTSRSIRYWSKTTGGPLWEQDLRTRTVASALHILARWRREAPPSITFLTYVAHHVWAAANVAKVIDKAAYAELRRLIPRPVEPLRMYALVPSWDHPWSEAHRAETVMAAADIEVRNVAS